MATIFFKPQLLTHLSQKQNDGDPGIILGMGSASERRYNATLFLIGGAHTHKGPVT